MESRTGGGGGGGSGSGSVLSVEEDICIMQGQASREGQHCLNLLHIMECCHVECLKRFLQMVGSLASIQDACIIVSVQHS